MQAVDLLQQLKIPAAFGGGFLARLTWFLLMYMFLSRKRSNRSRILLSGLSDASAKPAA